MGEGPGPARLVGAMLVGGPPPGAPGKGDGPPGPGVEALDGAGEPGKGTEGGPEVGGPEKLLGGVLKGWGPPGPGGKGVGLTEGGPGEGRFSVGPGGLKVGVDGPEKVLGVGGLGNPEGPTEGGPWGSEEGGPGGPFQPRLAGSASRVATPHTLTPHTRQPATGGGMSQGAPLTASHTCAHTGGLQQPGHSTHLYTHLASTPCTPARAHSTLT